MQIRARERAGQTPDIARSLRTLSERIVAGDERIAGAEARPAARSKWRVVVAHELFRGETDAIAESHQKETNRSG